MEKYTEEYLIEMLFDMLSIKRRMAEALNTNERNFYEYPGILADLKVDIYNGGWLRGYVDGFAEITGIILDEESEYWPTPPLEKTEHIWVSDLPDDDEQIYGTLTDLVQIMGHCYSIRHELKILLETMSDEFFIYPDLVNQRKIDWDLQGYDDGYALGLSDGNNFLELSELMAKPVIINNANKVTIRSSSGKVKYSFDNENWIDANAQSVSFNINQSTTVYTYSYNEGARSLTASKNLIFDNYGAQDFCIEFLPVEDEWDDGERRIRIVSSVYPSNLSTYKSIDVKINNGEYVTHTSGSYITGINAGDKVYLRCSDISGARFIINGKFNVSGNIFSLNDYEDAVDFDNYEFENLLAGNSGLISAANLKLVAEHLVPGCYSGMFRDCTSLTGAPELPSVDLAEQCYHLMFSGCTSLTIAPELPAERIVGNGAYSNMFEGCTSLVTAPLLNSEILTDNCYYSMFRNCTSLENPPELPANTLYDGCYEFMFYGCTSLENPPKLRAMNLAPTCYRYMFGNCTSIVNPPELPATTLAMGCYEKMFENCISIEEAPALMASNLVNQCYNGMFGGCSSLRYIKCMAATANIDGMTTKWTGNPMNSQNDHSTVSATGLFEYGGGRVWARGTSGIPTGWNIVNIFYTEPTNIEDIPLTFEIKEVHKAQAGHNPYLDFSNVKCRVNDSILVVPTVELLDSLHLEAGDTIRIQGYLDPNNILGRVSIRQFGTNYGSYVDYYCYGSFKSITGVNDNWATNNNNILMLDSLFKYDAHLYNHPTKDMIYPFSMMSQSPGDPGMYEMFAGCTNLTRTPIMNITRLNTTNVDGIGQPTYGNNYNRMFEGCTSLTTIKMTIPVVHDWCCYYMFSGCTSLSKVPINMLPATTLKPHCYDYMFKDCTHLISGPHLPATNLVSDCYKDMFVGTQNWYGLKVISCYAINNLEAGVPQGTLAIRNYSFPARFIVKNNTGVNAWENANKVGEGGYRWTLYTTNEAYALLDSYDEHPEYYENEDYFFSDFIEYVRELRELEQSNTN